MKRARDIKEQLVKLCERVEINALEEKLSLKNDETINNIRKSITSGFFYNVAKLHNDGDYKTLKNAHIVQVKLYIITVIRFTLIQLCLKKSQNG